MKHFHLNHISTCLLFGAALLFNACTTCHAQASDAEEAVVSEPVQSEQQLLLLGKSTFSPTVPAKLEVKKALTGHLLVQPVVNGRPAGWYIFDTGAGVGCVTSSSATELDLKRIGAIDAAGSGTKADSPVYRARDLVLGPLRCSDHPLMAVDLAFLEQHLGYKISGIIGFGLLSRCVAVIDLQDGSISLHDPDKYKLPRGEWTTLDLSQRSPIITAVFEGHKGRFLLDTGDHGHVTFVASAVRKWKLLENRDLTDSRLGGVGGVVAAKSGEIAKLEIAGLTLEDVPATFVVEAKGTYAQTNRAGKLGAGVLKRFVLVVDYGSQRMALLARE